MRGFEVSNLDDYKKGVGFIVDNPLDYMPGNVIKNIDSLLNFINDVTEGVDSYATERKKIRNLYHKYCDDKSAKRIVDFFGLGGNSE